MSVFLDTNILAYLFDDDEGHKQTAARELLLSLTVPAYVSTQVLVELHAVLTRKLHVSRLDAGRVLEAINYPVVSTDAALVARAAHTATEHSLSVFEALVVESAASAGARELWTEDLSTGSTIRGVEIVNPFLTPPA